MHIAVDQSGKIEQTDKATALAFSNGISYAVLIPARVKRKAITILRATGRRGKSVYISLFAAALYQLLKDHLDKIEGASRVWDMFWLELERPGEAPAGTDHTHWQLADIVPGQ
ncbi:MAG: hypothetical protein FJZ89_09230, partial [Chloroflexi bacterium]|nr:hypothetical protein [Chloroflexota bacterium]